MIGMRDIAWKTFTPEVVAATVRAKEKLVAAG